MNKDSDGLDWLREIRKQIATECDNDIKALGDYYRDIQKEYETKMRTYSVLQDTKVVSKTEIPNQTAQSDLEPVQS